MQLSRLISNHLDAWAVTLVSGGVALFVHDAWSAAGALLVLALGAGTLLAFAFNDWCDAPYDAHDPAKAAANAFTRAGGAPRLLLSMLAALVLLVVVLFLSYGWRGGAVLLAGLAVAVAYSAPPLRLKHRPGLDLLAHSLFVETFPYAVVLLLLRLPVTVLDVAILAILALGSMSAQLEQQLRDFDVDRLSGPTLARAIGRRRSYRLLQVLTLSLMGVALWGLWRGIFPALLLPYGLIALPALLHRLVRGAHRGNLPQLRMALPLAAAGYTLLLVWLLQ